MHEPKMTNSSEGSKIEGRHSVLEAFRAEQLIERLFVQKGCHDGPVLSILREAKKSGVMIDFVPKDRLDHMSETGRHQGVIACISAFHYSDIEEMYALAEKILSSFCWTASKTRTISAPLSARRSAPGPTASLSPSAARSVSPPL